MVRKVCQDNHMMLDPMFDNIVIAADYDPDPEKMEIKMTESMHAEFRRWMNSFEGMKFAWDMCQTVFGDTTSPDPADLWINTKCSNRIKPAPPRGRKATP